MSLKKGKLICFIGIDGSGKSTLSKMFCRYLTRNNVKCKYVYGRLLTKLVRPIFIMVQKIFLRKNKMNYRSYLRSKYRLIKKHKLIAKIYAYLLVFEYFWLILFKIRLPLLFGYTIVCDRYVYDTVINDLPIIVSNKKEVISWVDTIFKFAPQPDKTFLVDIPEEIALRRKRDIPNIEYIREKRKAYKSLKKKYKEIRLIWGAGRKEAVFKAILKEANL